MASATVPFTQRVALHPPGRPAGSKNPTVHEKIRRELTSIYEAVRRQAVAGDAAAAALCFDIVRNPGNYPLPERDHIEG